MTPRPLFACFLLALGLRAGAAVFTEYAPIFPAYYYTDAQIVEKAAVQVADAWRSGRSLQLSHSQSQRVHAYLLAAFYHVFGHRPLAAKLLMALLAALAVVLFAAAAAPVFGAGPALASALLIAVWPSHVFFTSQNLKEPIVILLGYASLLGLMRPLLPRRAGEARTPKSAVVGLAAAAAALSALGFFRTYLMMTWVCVLGAGLAAAVIRDRRSGRSPRLAWLGLCASFLAAPAYVAASRALFAGPLRPPASAVGDSRVDEGLLPSTYDDSARRHVQPFSPEGITRTRLLRQTADRYYARTTKGREIGTQLFFGLEQ